MGETTENQAAQIQRLKELLGVISPGEWYVARDVRQGSDVRSGTPHSFNSVGAGLDDIANISDYTRMTDTESDAEFIALSRNLAQPMLDAWEQNLRRAELLSEYDDLVHRIGEERDAALEQVKALEAALKGIIDWYQPKHKYSSICGLCRPSDEEASEHLESCPIPTALQALSPKPEPELKRRPCMY